MDSKEPEDRPAASDPLPRQKREASIGCAARHSSLVETLSAQKATRTRRGKKAKVRMASGRLMMSGDVPCNMITSHRYANTEKKAVTT